MDAASMAMINLLSEKRKLDRLDAYGLASVTPKHWPRGCGQTEKRRLPEFC
jgi:hypothetical protein